MQTYHYVQIDFGKHYHVLSFHILESQTTLQVYQNGVDSISVTNDIMS